MALVANPLLLLNRGRAALLSMTSFTLARLEQESQPICARTDHVALSGCACAAGPSDICTQLLELTSATECEAKHDHVCKLSV